MKKIGFACIWFGKMPNFMIPWLKTCQNNPTIDFHLFTDVEDEIEFPGNVYKHYIPLKEFIMMFVEGYDFETHVDTAYKLCDIRPAFGEILQEYLKEYEYWGYCDEDLLWGDIRHFITDEILEKHERILTRGHCSIYRNTPEINRYYRELPRNGHMSYEEVLQEASVCAFDEWAEHRGGGVSAVFRDNGISMYNEPIMADIFVPKGNFVINYRPDLQGTKYFLYDHGRLFACGKNKSKGNFKEEVLYCHFQKRVITIAENINYDYFKFEPVGRLCNVEDSTHLLKRNVEIVKKNFRYLLSSVYGKVKHFFR